MSETDQSYYRRRAGEERQRAKEGGAPEIVECHAELASLYELRLADPEGWASLSTQDSS